MKERKTTMQFVICPACQGSGRAGTRACPDCGGLGAGVFSNNFFFYWGEELDPIAIRVKKIKRKFDLALNLFAYLISLSGLLSLGWWFWEKSSSSGLEYLLFWQFKNSLILYFWLGFLAGMFVFYRLLREREGEKIVKEKDLPVPVSAANSWEDLKRTKYKMDISRGFGKEALRLIDEAFLISKSWRQTLGPVHLFLAILQDQLVDVIFFRLNADIPGLAEKVKGGLESYPEGEGVSEAAKEIFVEAYLDARAREKDKVEPIDLIASIIGHDERIAEILYDSNIDQDKINNSLKWIDINRKILKKYQLYRKMARYKPSSAMDRAYTAVATPALNHYGYDLTLAAKWGRLELCIAREKEIQAIFDDLESGSFGIVLVGQPGVGKNTVMAGLAELMVEENVPKMLKDKRLVELDVARLVSGAAPEQAHERLLVILDEVAAAGNIILYINNLQNIMGIQAGEGENLDLSEILAGQLDKANLYCFASITDQNYRKSVEGRPLGNLMTKVEIEEPAGNQAIQIIEAKVGRLEGKYGAYFSYDALSEAVKLSSKYMHDKYLPEKAIDILESVAQKAGKRGKEKRLITQEEVAMEISEITDIPLTKISQSESENLLNLEEKIHERMIGQEEAVDMIAASLRRARVELREGKRPIANFLFLGPTGVGKTELAKTIAEVYFGDEAAMVRLDMSEYQHPDSLTKMIGDAGNSGYLTEAVRLKPFSLVLLDEFEKAHPEILNLFLQVMDDGRLTDGQGRTIDFTNTIVIATSNAGALFIEEEIVKGTDMETIKQVLINEHLNKVMRPELINRFDGVIVFKPLTEENVASIARLMLEKIRRMLEEKGIGLEAEEEGIKRLAKDGFDPKFGARPLRRVLQDKIENIIANKILAGELERRDTVIIDGTAGIRVEKGKEL